MARKLTKDQIVYKGCLATHEDIVSVPRTLQTTLNINGTPVTVNITANVAEKVSRTVPVLVKLRLPKGKAVVVSIVDQKGNRYASAFAKRTNSFSYYAGEEVLPHFFDTHITECSGGIHFYRKPEKAWEWVGVKV